MYQYLFFVVVFFFKQKTSYEMRISDWSSDVCSSDLAGSARPRAHSGRRCLIEPPFAVCSRSGVAVAGRAAMPVETQRCGVVVENGRAAWRERVCQSV